MKAPVPSELLIHIGNMTVSFALLELHMQVLFSTPFAGIYEYIGASCSMELSLGRFAIMNDFDVL